MSTPARILPRLLAAALLAVTSFGAVPPPALAHNPHRHAAAPADPDDPGFGAPYLVRDLNAAATPVSSFPSYFVLLPSGLYFTADTPAQGRELYVADGGGVSLVRDLYPGSP